ncbi:MAG: hypothetical protein ACO4B0_03765 [bacterium]
MIRKSAIATTTLLLLAVPLTWRKNVPPVHWKPIIGGTDRLR